MNTDINKNLFDLTPEQIETSKMIYEGKIVKCLVAPYHTYEQLEKIVPFTKTTYLFPEREVPIPKLKGLISAIVANPSNEEFRIITANQNVILDMVDSSVRVLTEDGRVVDCPVKTFMANIHDIRYSILENEAHQISKEDKTKAHDKINKIINILNDKKKSVISQNEYDSLSKEIDLIGEPIIRTKLMEMLREKEVSGSSSKTMESDKYEIKDIKVKKTVIKKEAPKKKVAKKKVVVKKKKK